MSIEVLDELQSIRKELLAHPIYHELTTPDRVRVFMKHHIFAVWDFMSLLKRLQRSVTCVDVPWFPYEQPLFSRLINEIVVAEESDINGKGGYTSHFELYLEAMAECGADLEPFYAFANSLKSGTDFQAVFYENPLIRSTVRDFVTFNLDLALHGELFEVAAVFFFGREGLIPEMFKPLVDSLMETDSSSERLVFYLNRHIEVDEDHHGPLAEQLFLELCGNDPEKLNRAREIGAQGLKVRMALWDGVLAEIKEGNL